MLIFDQKIRTEWPCHRGSPTQTDQNYIGLWIGLIGMDNCGGREEESSWMASTWRAFWMVIDPEHGTSVLRKPRRSIMGIPNPVRSWDRLSPSFMHFVGLKPKRRYSRLAADFNNQVDFEHSSQAGSMTARRPPHVAADAHRPRTEACLLTQLASGREAAQWRGRSSVTAALEP